MGGSYNCNYFYYKYFFGYKSERDDISNACTGNRILTSLKIMEVIIEGYRRAGRYRQDPGPRVRNRVGGTRYGGNGK